MLEHYSNYLRASSICGDLREMRKPVVLQRGNTFMVLLTHFYVIVRIY